MYYFCCSSGAQVVLMELAEHLVLTTQTMVFANERSSFHESWIPGANIDSRSLTMSNRATSLLDS